MSIFCQCQIFVFVMIWFGSMAVRVWMVVGLVWAAACFPCLAWWSALFFVLFLLVIVFSLLVLIRLCPVGCGCVGFSTESLILAQDERWRRA